MGGEDGIADFDVPPEVRVHDEAPSDGECAANQQTGKHRGEGEDLLQKSYGCRWRR
jgi:hypothetical protein